MYRLFQLIKDKFQEVIRTQKVARLSLMGTSPAPVLGERRLTMDDFDGSTESFVVTFNDITHVDFDDCRNVAHMFY